MIGIVSGAGPLAGLDVAQKIIGETLAQRDQDHLPVVLLSLPEEIPDRTEFLLGRITENPGPAIGKIFLRLEMAGAKVAAIACNTAHAEPIFKEINALVVAAGSQLQVLNIIEESVSEIHKQFDHGATLAVLSTRGTHDQKLYRSPLEAAGFTVLEPDEEGVNRVHQAIYDPQYGIKASADFFNGRGVQDLVKEIDILIERGAEAILLGCTELPLAVTDRSYKRIPIIDPNLILARRFIEITAPEKLR